MSAVTTSMAEMLLYVYNTAGFRDQSLLKREFGGFDADVSKPDSLGYGSLGRCLFACELYKYTCAPEILDDLEDYLSAMEDHVRCRRSNNHSLLNGRSGIAYLYLQLYKSTRRKLWLDKAVSLVQEYWKKDHGNLQFFDYKGLVNGTAGIILFYLELLEVVKQEWLVDHIRRCVLDLVSKTNLGTSGIYWPREHYEDDPHAIWAHDRMAIALCCMELGRRFRHDGLSRLGAAALAHEDNLPDVARSYANGGIGRLLVRVYAGVRGEGRHYMADLEELAEDPGCLLRDNLPGNLYYGLAGWGLGFKEAYRLTKDQRYMYAAEKIGIALADRMTNNLYETRDLTFFTGLSGIGYALLKITGDDPSPSLMLPGIQYPGNAPGDVFCFDLGIDQAVINKLLIKNSFKETFLVVKEKLSPALDIFFSNGQPVDLPQFSQWVYELGKDEPSGDAEETIIETFEKEMKAGMLKEKLPFFAKDDDIAFAKRADDIFRLKDDELLELKLSVSDKYIILKREPYIDLSGTLSNQEMDVIFGTYGAKSFFLRPDRFNHLDGRQMNIWRLYIDLFEGSPSVADVAGKIIAFAGAQKDQASAVMLKRLGATDAAHRDRILMEGFLTSAKWMYALGILDIHPSFV